MQRRCRVRGYHDSQHQHSFVKMTFCAVCAWGGIPLERENAHRAVNVAVGELIMRTRSHNASSDVDAYSWCTCSMASHW